jgi:hypothetical protein
VLSRFLKLTIVLLLTMNASMPAQKNSESQKQDLERLLSAAVPFAEEMLKRHGEFYPYGSTMDSEGKISATSGYTGTEHPASTELIGLLKAAFTRDAKAGKIMACALVYDVKTLPPGKIEKIDAIRVDLDHRDGMSLAVVFPYAIAPNKTVTLSEPFAMKGKGEVFAPPHR